MEKARPMTNFVLQAHSGWRYLVILVVVLAIAKSLYGLFTGARWSKLDQTLGMLTPIMFDIQLLLGLVLWIMGQYWSVDNPTAAWEHPVIMILAVAVAHIAWTRVKRAATDQAKFQNAGYGFLVAGLLLALGVARITRLI
jgi:hypothetical protein